VGDISHTLPVLRTIQQAWPETAISWIIGKQEYQLVHDIADIEFIQFDKKAGWRGYREIRRTLAHQRFDVLLDMQMSLRASLISLFINSPIKLGFDKQRTKDYQWLFTNQRIRYQAKQHVIDSFFGFTEALGLSERVYKWDIPVPEFNIQDMAEELLPSQKYVVISPCSSMAYRNWTAKGYAEVADYIQDRYKLKVIICGGNSEIERDYAKQISTYSTSPIINLVAKTSLKQLMAVLKNAELVIAPDAGPAHLANAVGTPVVGLYATTNPDRARPYHCAELVVSKYAEAVMGKYAKKVSEVPWGTRVRDEGTMARITTDDVIEAIDKSLTIENHSS